MILNCCVISGPGLIREENQDNFYVNGFYRKDTKDTSAYRYGDSSRGDGLYAVADGMGGEKHGALASLIAVSALGEVSLKDGSDGIKRYLAQQNAIICDLISKTGGARIGSAFAGLCTNGENADIVNIGDSRAYLLRNGALTQLSEDHTLIRQMVDFGAVTKESARTHPDRHKLTQHLGIFPSEIIIEPYSTRVAIETGDIFLLCSDGLTDMLEDSEIALILTAQGTIEEKLDVLYKAAMRRGGRDNLTILLVEAIMEEESVDERTL